MAYVSPAIAWKNTRLRLPQSPSSFDAILVNAFTGPPVYTPIIVSHDVLEHVLKSAKPVTGEVHRYHTVLFGPVSAAGSPISLVAPMFELDIVPDWPVRVAASANASVAPSW